MERERGREREREREWEDCSPGWTTDSTGLGVSYIQGIIASPFANFNPEISWTVSSWNSVLNSKCKKFVELSDKTVLVLSVLSEKW